MGCGASTEEKEKKVPAVICRGTFKTKGYHPEAVPLSSKLDPTSKIKVNCGTIYVKPHVDTKVDCFVMYPDPREIKKDATTLVADRVRQDTLGPVWEKGPRVQVKEFDSLDDVYKDWYEAPGHGNVPGVHLVEDAGPFGAWVSFSPNSYQTRFVTTEGRRMWSPIADSGHQHISVPQRLHRVYKEHGEKAIMSLCTRFSQALTNIQEEMNEMGTPSFLTDLLFDPSEAVKALMVEFDKMEHYHTVFEFPEVLHPLRDILAEIEDNLIYNWFDVSIDCNMQIGTYRFHRRSNSTSKDWSLFDKALGWALENLNEGVDAVLLEIRGEIRERIKEVANKWIKPKPPKKREATSNSGSKSTSRTNTPSTATPGEEIEEVELPDDEADNLLTCLFPDLEELVEAVIHSIDGEVMGVVEELPENSASDEVEEAGGILKLLEKWREEDAMDVEKKREKFYNKTTNSLQPQLKAFNKPGLKDTDELDLADQKILDRVARFPMIIPKHFYDFSFFLVFPRFDPEEKENMKCPKKAVLNIWPEGEAPSAETGALQEVKMSFIAIDNGGPDNIAASAQSFANKMFQDGDGDSSIDSSDGDADPRNKWVDYPGEDWRGYQCKVTLATHCTYNFHFVLDGHIFLDHDTWSKDPSGQSGECRRVRFKDACRPYTVNPLRPAGVVL